MEKMISRNNSGIYVMEGRKEPGFVVTPTCTFRIPEYKRKEALVEIREFMSEFRR